MTAGTLYGAAERGYPGSEESCARGNADFSIKTLAYLEGIGEPAALTNGPYPPLYILRVTKSAAVPSKEFFSWLSKPRLLRGARSSWSPVTRRIQAQSHYEAGEE